MRVFAQADLLKVVDGRLHGVNRHSALLLPLFVFFYSNDTGFNALLVINEAII